MHEVIIIGSGPAGMAASLQLKRSGIGFLLLEKKTSGTLLKNAGRVENYLGFNAVTGVGLLKTFKRHIMHHNIRPILEEVTFMDYEETDERFKVQTNKTIYYAKRVLVASGTAPKRLDVANRLESLVSYELPLNFKKNLQEVAIIGAGDAAFDYAITLAEKHVVHIFNRGKTIKALPSLKKLVLQNKNISYRENLRLDGIEEEGSRLRLKFNAKTADSTEVDVDFLIIAIGREAQKVYYSSNVLKREKQLIQNKLLFLAGDVKNEFYRQVVLATADGIRAAMQIYHEFL